MVENHKPEIIDVWANPPLAEMFSGLPEVKRLFEQSGTAGVLESGLSPAQIVDQMDAAGINRLLVTSWVRPGRTLASNDRVFELIQDYPERLLGVAGVDLERPVAAVKELGRAIQELGFKALRIIPWLWKLPPNNRLYYPLYVKCIELNIPFCTQVGHTGPLMTSETGRPIPYIDDVALTFPELRIVCGHIGYPWTDEMIALAWKHEHVYIDTSAHLPRYYPPQLLHFMNSYGQDKVLFGTNFPMLDLKKCTDQAAALELKAEVRAKFLSGNANRVFNL